MSRMRIWITATVLLAVVASAAGLALAHVSSGDAEVRISAKRLDDGRTEFALQQRIDGEWGERILPRSRFFPASPGHDRWLNSSVLEIETTASESISDTDAEESSQALADAQAEAAAAKAEATEAKEALAAAEEALAEAQAPPAIVRTPGESAYDGGRIVTEVSFGYQQVTPISAIRVRADGDFGLRDKPLTLVISCRFDGSKTIEFENTPPPTVGESQPSGYTPRTFLVSYKFSPTPEAGDIGAVDVSWNAQQVWNQTRGEYYFRPYAPNQLRLYWTLRQAEQLEIAIVGADDETVEATFTMAGVWDTPIQPNLDHCGDYY